MKSHPAVAWVGYWKGSDPLLVLSFIVNACVGTEAGGKWNFCRRFSRGVESWGTLVRAGCRKTRHFGGSSLCPEASPSSPLLCDGGETQILSQASGQKSQDE